MRRLAFAILMLAAPVSAERHIAELYQGILGCETRDCVGEAAQLCMDIAKDGHTTFGMMDCFLKERDVWDELLNEAYADARAWAKILDADDAESFPEYAIRDTQVRDAQRAWIAFRDTNCSMEYGLWGPGSMRQIAGADCLMRMTAERTFDLRAYADGLR